MHRNYIATEFLQLHCSSYACTYIPTEFQCLCCSSDVSQLLSGWITTTIFQFRLNVTAIRLNYSCYFAVLMHRNWFPTEFQWLFCSSPVLQLLSGWIVTTYYFPIPMNHNCWFGWFAVAILQLLCIITAFRLNIGSYFVVPMHVNCFPTLK